MSKSIWSILIPIGLAGVASIGYSYHVSKKTDNILDKMGMAVDKTSADLDIDIPEKIVKQAVEKAVNAAVDEELCEATSYVRDEVEDRIMKDVRKVTNETYEEMKPQLKDRVVQQFDNIDISEVKQEVIKAAAERASQKFDDELKLIMDGYKDQIKNISNMYKTLTNRIGTVSNDDAVSFIFR